MTGLDSGLQKLASSAILARRCLFATHGTEVLQRFDSARIRVVRNSLTLRTEIVQTALGSSRKVVKDRDYLLNFPSPGRVEDSNLVWVEYGLDTVGESLPELVVPDPQFVLKVDCRIPGSI